MSKTVSDASVIIGVDTHKSTHAAVAISALGTRLGSLSIPASGRGYQALLGGEVHCGFDTTASTLGQLRDGTLRALAVTSGARTATLPDVPSFAEAGPPLAEMAAAEFWYGLYAPGSTLAATLAQLSEQAGAVLRDPATAARLLDMDLTPRPMTPAAFAAVIAADVARWEPVIKASGFTVNN